MAVCLRVDAEPAMGETKTSPDRYFPATIMGGRLHVTGVADWGPWDSSRLDWWPEDHLDLILAKGEYGAKVRTLEELEAALRAPMKVAPTRRVWIHESLERDARCLWERKLLKPKREP